MYSAPAEEMSEQQESELYGAGTTITTTSASQQTGNPASSIADLRALLEVAGLVTYLSNIHFCQREESLIYFLKHHDKLEVVRDALAEDDYSLESVHRTDVLHPVDGYNLIKRTARSWARVKDRLAASELPDSPVLERIQRTMVDFPTWENSR